MIFTRRYLFIVASSQEISFCLKKQLEKLVSYKVLYDGAKFFWGAILILLCTTVLFDRAALTLHAQDVPSDTTTASSTEQASTNSSIPLNDDHSIGNYIWLDSNNNGRADVNEDPVPNGVVLSLLYANGTSAGKTALTSNGYYLFNNLSAGQYRVQILAGNFITPNGKLADYTHSTGLYQEVDPNLNRDQVDHGLDDTEPRSKGIKSGIIDIGDNEPLLEKPTSDGVPGSGTVNRPDEHGNLTLDFGVAPIITPTVSLGNQVWYDADGDGFVDPLEIGIDGVDVQLYIAGQNPLVDTALYTQTTRNGGYYTFTNLIPETYFVYIPTPPTEYPLTSRTAMTTSVPLTTTAPLFATNPITTVSPFTTAVLMNDVDNDNNGVQLIQGGPVQSPLVLLEISLEPLDDGDDANGNLTIDFGFVATATVPITPTITITPTNVLTPTLSLGNQIWHDENRNGLYDIGEAGIPDLEVQLFTAGQAPLSVAPLYTQTTTSSGHYSFTNLDARTYFVYIPRPPVAYPLSSPLAATETSTMTGAVDNRGIQLQPNGPVQSAFITLSLGDEPTDDGDDANGDLTIDFGFMTQQIESYTIGDRVWHDVNNNGLFDNNEMGISSVELRLYSSGADPDIDPPVKIIKSNLNGYYQFENVQTGTYFVYISTPPSTFPNSSSVNGEVNSKVDGDDNGLQSIAYAPVQTEEFTIPLPNIDSRAQQIPSLYTASAQIEQRPETIEVIDSIDFGFFSSSISIGDRVWFDNDNNGRYDPENGEMGVPNVDVLLYDATNSAVPLARTKTLPNGLYLFLNILPGSYYVIFDLDTLPVGYLATRPNIGGDDSRDSDADPTSGRAPTFGSINPMTLDSSLDLGIIQTASIGDIVWYDINRDGIQAADETGLSTTNSRIGIPGVQVKLLDGQSNNLIETQTTGSDGQYRFHNLIPGTYYVEFDLPRSYTPSPKDAANNNIFDSDADFNSDIQSLRTDLITLSAGEHNPTIDLGAYLISGLPVSIGDFVWFDADRDGSQGIDEVGMPDVVVQLYNEVEGTISQTSTDRNGQYRFQNLAAGNYSLYFVPPTGFIASPRNAGTDSSRDSDISDSTGRTVSTVLSSAEVDSTWDAGFYTNATLLSSIGDRVWHDVNINGIQDEEMNTAGIPGVVVTLYQKDGGVVDIKVTDEKGEYRFNNLLSGIYYIGFDPPEEYVPSLAHQGIDKRLDSDMNPVTLLTEQTLLTPLENDITFDAGFYRRGATSADAVPSSIGNRVWLDLDGDGYQDIGEGGIQSVVVKLYNQDGELVTVTQTDSTGTYLFRSVIPGTYYIEFVLPDERYIFSPQNPKFVNTSNSDVNPQIGRTSAIEIEAGVATVSWDAGMINTTLARNGNLYLPLVAK